MQGSGSGPGTLLRETDTTYRFQDTGGTDYENNGLTGLPSQVKVYDGSSHPVAQTNYAYDETSYSAGLIAGELTTVKKWKDASHHDDTHTSFNSDGTWTESVDANGIKTHANSFDCSSAFPKRVTKAYGTPIAETFVYSHDCDTGKVTSYIDANSKTTSYTYADALNRVTAVDYPDGGHAGITYTDGANSSTKVEVDTDGSQGKLSQTVIYDLVGRTVQVQQNTGSDVINVDTKYDAMGHLYSTSNPYTGAQSSSSDVTVNTYDELERLIQKMNPDGSAQIFSYSGNVITTKDEVGNAWQRTSDALGELTQVVEPNGAKTNYTYTARGNLATVNQAGLTGEVARNRSFDCDWLSRLKQSNNEEAGWICYGTISGSFANGTNCTADYDGNGNLKHKTDALGITISYNYEALNRLTSKTYSDGTPGVIYDYDGDGLWGANCGSLTASQFTKCNTIGRLWHIATTDWKTGAEFGYDAMGRVITKASCIDYACETDRFDQYFTYDLAGNLTSYDHGFIATHNAYLGGQHTAYDAAGRISWVGSTGSGLPRSTYSEMLFTRRSDWWMRTWAMAYTRIANMIRDYGRFGSMLRGDQM